jgi:tetratricopeptide (TPR) repeat protein
MGEHDLRRVEELFQTAADLPAGARGSFLDRECRGESSLRTHVEALLAHLDGGATLASPAAEAPGTIIDRYKLLQVIGQGGFGIVYMAEQLQPVVRKVALKIIKLGMDTREVVARFEAERQALALMDHPNIARVLDGGATRSGRPYFVMELVRGVSITDYCDRHELSPVQRLELFEQVCHAVQHAHQKGVIHRDLKPSNVLVTLHDGIPMPKIIDFGVAKAMHARLTDKTLFTRYEQFIGTPAYMSPEQAEMSGLDVDTRADIYALGVLLYELLTGTTPFDGEALRKAGLAELQRVIRDERPPRPSVRISAAGTTAADVARRRNLDAAALRKRLRGDLDWIVMKALEKERGRRYATAAAFADDVRRHLRREPVQAGPPGAAYRVRKFLARNRAGTASAAAIVVALLAGIVAVAHAKLEADRNAAAAKAQAENAVDALDFLDSVLTLTDPGVALDPAVSVRTILDDAAARVGDAFAAQPWAEIRVRATIGAAYASLSEAALAERQLRRVVELVDANAGGTPPGDPAFGAAGFDTGDFYRTLWKLTNVCFALERGDSFAIAGRAGEVGLGHIRSRYPRSSDALRRLCEHVGQSAWSLEAGAMEPAGPLLADAVRATAAEIPAGEERWPIVANLYLACGYMLWYTPHEPFAERLWRAALDVQQRELPPDHPHIAMTMNLLVGILNRLGRLTEAERLVRDAIASLERTAREGDLPLALAESSLGECLSAQGRFVEAEEIMLAAHRLITAKILDENTFTVVESTIRIVDLYEKWQRPEPAAPYRESLARVAVGAPYAPGWRQTRLALGPEHAALAELLGRIDEACGGPSYVVAPSVRAAAPDLIARVDAVAAPLDRLAAVDELRAVATARLLVGWANAIDPDAGAAARARLAEIALATFAAAGEEVAAAHGAVALSRAEAHGLLAEAALRGGDREAAVAHARAAWEEMRDVPECGFWFEAAVRVRVGRALLRAGLFAEAETVLRAGYETLRVQLGDHQGDTVATRAMLRELAAATGRPEEVRRDDD